MSGAQGGHLKFHLVGRFRGGGALSFAYGQTRLETWESWILQKKPRDIEGLRAFRFIEGFAGSRAVRGH